MLAGCGSKEAGHGSAIPSGLTQPLSSASASAPPASGSADPGLKVSDPLNTQALEANPCTVITSSQVSTFGLSAGTSRQGSTGLDCYWTLTAAPHDRLDIAPITVNKTGINGVYANKFKFEYFEPAQVSGYPAVYADQADQRSIGYCGLWVGLTDQLAVSVGTQLLTSVDKAKSCDIAKTFAEAMIQTMKAG
jgi:hypothetical protein